MSEPEPEPVYHYTTAADWQRSLAAGQHLVSGRGMTLSDEGFIHLCDATQRAGVWQRFWSGIDEPVVLLTVDTVRLDPPVVRENTHGGAELFPHLYGPLPVAAVLSVDPVDAEGLPV
ncbi:DUF952 domain-containing protein [Nakamurella sp. A5-74]|uniref:DUF952 domain-containing protein n=1 Tax=Nakamurella sp. A5-74 TaxID=3158264 RepID=A0AAU8DIY7_9ACTN